LHQILSAVDHNFGLGIQSQQGFGHGFFTVTTSHILNSEKLVHDVSFGPKEFALCKA
jgi:hypothetical protein